jgi:hypothetical protein
MKKFLKYFIVMPLLVIIGIYALNTIIYLTIWYFCYVRTDNLLITKIMETPVKINIPVKFSRLHDRHRIPGVSMRAADKMPYGLRCIPDKGVVWITATHMGFINVYSASYEVTDPKVRAELIEIFKRAWQEEEKLRQRAKNDE